MLNRKPTVGRDRTLISIDHKYNYQKVLSFISTDNARVTNVGIKYLSKYPNQFANVSILPDSIPLILSKFFRYVNEVDSHTKYRQSDLVLEKYQVHQCDWIWLCRAFSM